jgi:redox-sensitive bicupin YhaK (pirin superfamily)
VGGPGSYEVAVDPAFEHGLLVDRGSVRVDGVLVEPGHLAYVAPGRLQIDLTVQAGEPTRLLLLGGVPFGESIVMWWNFVGRSHEEIVDFRNAWQQTIRAAGATDVAPVGGITFGLPVDDPAAPLPAPELPGVRIRPRG